MIEQQHGAATIEILSESINKEWSLGEFVENYRLRLMQRAPGWQVYQEKRISGEFRGATNFVRIEFRRQISTGSCVENVVTELYRSRYFPKKLQGFAVSLSICEDSLRQFAQQRDSILSSFQESPTQ